MQQAHTLPPQYLGLKHFMITYKLMIVCWIKCDCLLSCILSLGNLKFKKTATVRFWRDDRFHLGDIESWDYMTYFCQRCCYIDAQQIIRNSTPPWWTGLPHAESPVHSADQERRKRTRAFWPLQFECCQYMSPRLSHPSPSILYIRRSDVTESMATIRSPFCGYNID